MATSDALRSYVETYTRSAGEQGGARHDLHSGFRHAVIDHVLQHPDVAPVELLVDLWLAEGRGNWAEGHLHPELPALGRLLLLRGRASVALEFLRGAMDVGPDQPVEAQIEVPEELIRELVERCDRMGGESADFDSMHLAASGVSRFAALAYRHAFGRDDDSAWIEYSEGTASHRFRWTRVSERWEGRVGEPLVEVATPPLRNWERETPWPISRRTEIVVRIGAELAAELPLLGDVELREAGVLIVQADPDKAFYDRLDEDVPARTCAADACGGHSVRFSLHCRRHQFESVRGRPCPFSR